MKNDIQQRFQIKDPDQPPSDRYMKEQNKPSSEKVRRRRLIEQHQETIRAREEAGYE